MNNKKVISDIKKIYGKYILKDVSSFCVDDYNDFEKEIWALKEKYQLEDSPFLLLPNPAKDADFEMMNASSDGLVEPSEKDKSKYLEKMRISYNEL